MTEHDEYGLHQPANGVPHTPLFKAYGGGKQRTTRTMTHCEKCGEPTNRTEELDDGLGEQPVYISLCERCAE